MDCLYCREEGRVELPKYVEDTSDTQVYVEPSTKSLVIRSGGEMSKVEGIVRYCPMCGRPLGMGAMDAGGGDVEFYPVKSYVTAKKRAPWAKRVAVVDGGFLAFESVVDYNKWREAGRGKWTGMER